MLPEKLLKNHTAYGVWVANKLQPLLEKYGIILWPITTVWVILWTLVEFILLGIDIVYGRIVYDLSCKEQFEYFMEGVKEGLNE